VFSRLLAARSVLRFLRVCRQVLAMRQHGVLLSLDEPPSPARQAGVLLLADRVERLAEMAKNMELFEEHRGLGRMAVRRHAKRLPHVHDRHVNLLRGCFAEKGEEPARDVPLDCNYKRRYRQPCALNGTSERPRRTSRSTAFRSTMRRASFSTRPGTMPRTRAATTTRNDGSRLAQSTDGYLPSPTLRAARASD